MARQFIVQPHFLHLTTQAVGSPKFRPVIPDNHRRINDEHHLFQENGCPSSLLANDPISDLANESGSYAFLDNSGATPASPVHSIGGELIDAILS